MEQHDVEALFARFAAPLSGFAALGGREAAVNELAKNLWVVLLAGPDAEDQIWQSLAESDSVLCDTVKACYESQMKPLISSEELSELRQRYWGSDDEAGDDQVDS